MRGLVAILGVFLVACGGNGGHDEDTSTDSPQDTVDTQGDTAPDTVPDTAEDTPVDTAADTSSDTAEDSVPDTFTDTTADTLIDTATDEVVEEEAPECTLDGDCDNGIFCDGEETCSAEGTCQAGMLVVCDDTDPCTTDRCNEDDDECTFDPTDSDGDGFDTATGPGGETCPGTDCDDTNNAIFPGALSVTCSPVDNDCNGNPDSDNDGDGHLDITCTGGEDCNDADAGVWDGAWYDPSTGNMWEDPPIGSLGDWATADNYCNNLTLCGRTAGDWHLPTISELRTLIRGCPATEDGGVCGVTDTCLDDACNHDCGGCFGGGGPGASGCYWDPAVEGTCGWYWSASSYSAAPIYAWSVSFLAGYVGIGIKYSGYGLGGRCVMSGP